MVSSDQPAHPMHAVGHGLVLKPDPGRWAARATEHAAAGANRARTLAFRRELGIDLRGPVVMSGHQAQWWHAGIFAKRAAACAVADQLGTVASWVVVDQDASDSLALPYPAAATGGEPLPQRRLWTIAPAGLAAELRADVALADLPAFEPVPPPGDAATPEVARALRAVADCLSRARAGAATAAEQISRACEELAGTVHGRVALLSATAIAQSAAFRHVLERISDDPRSCVDAFNSAVVQAGGNGVGPLTCQHGRIELPLWRLSTPGARSPRARVFAHTLGQVPISTLAPRGPLMTAMLRWLGCDLFIHGTGGGATGEPGGYDKVAEAWFRLWLGEEIAPSVTATATLLALLGHAPTVSITDVQDAQRLAHAAQHTPALLGDQAAQRIKDQLVASIAAQTDRAARLEGFRALQKHLESYRDAHRLRLAALDPAPIARLYQQQQVLRDRTWPWPIHHRAVLRELHEAAAALVSGQPLAGGGT